MNHPLAEQSRRSRRAGAIFFDATELRYYDDTMLRRYGISQAPARAVASSAVVKRRYAEKPSVLTLKVESDFLQAIDTEVLVQSNQEGRIMPRSDVVKALIQEALAARAKKRSR